MKTIGYYKFALEVNQTVSYIKEKLSEVKTVNDAETNIRSIDFSYDNLKYNIHFPWGSEGLYLLHNEFDKLKQRAYDIKESVSQNTLPNNEYTYIDLFYKHSHYFFANSAICRVLDILKGSVIDDFGFIYKTFEYNVEDILEDTNEELCDELFGLNPPENKEEAKNNILIEFKKQLYSNKDKIITIAKDLYNISFVKEE